MQHIFIWNGSVAPSVNDSDLARECCVSCDDVWVAGHRNSLSRSVCIQIPNRKRRIAYLLEFHNGKAAPLHIETLTYDDHQKPISQSAYSFLSVIIINIFIAHIKVVQHILHSHTLLHCFKCVNIMVGLLWGVFTRCIPQWKTSVMYGNRIVLIN